MAGCYHPAIVLYRRYFVTRGFPILALILSLFASACSQEPSLQSSLDKKQDVLVLKESRFEDLSGWTLDAQQQAVSALSKSCEKIKNMDSTRSLGSDPLGSLKFKFPDFK